MDMEDLRIHLKRNRAFIAFAGLLVFGSGCAGAIRTTGDELTEDALSPITVPVREGGNAVDRLEGIQAQQEERNRRIEEAGE